MSASITATQRQQVAEDWRQSHEAQRMAPRKAEQFAQQILSGAADNHVAQYLPRLKVQQQSSQEQAVAPMIDLATFFDGLCIPDMRIPPIVMAPPMQSPLLPQLPQPLPYPAISTPQMRAMPIMPLLPIGAPLMHQHTTHFPGGHAYHQNISVSGHNGSATFSYSSSSTSESWSNNGNDHTINMQSAPLAVQHHPPPVGVEAVPSRSRIIHVEPPMPVQPAPQQAAPAPSRIPPQNPRLGRAFARLQKQEEPQDTYFNYPPGLPDPP